MQRENDRLPVHTDSATDVTTKNRQMAVRDLCVFLYHIFDMQLCSVCPSTLIQNDDTMRRYTTNGYPPEETAWRGETGLGHEIRE